MALWLKTLAPFSEHKGGVGSFLKIPRSNSAIEPVTITFLFELIPLKCIYLHRGYFGLIKKYQKCASTDRGRWNKNSEQSANNQNRREIFACQTIVCCFL